MIFLTYSQSTVISNTWNDDFVYDDLSGNVGVTGWHIYGWIHAGPNEYNTPSNKITIGDNGKKYHGPFSRIINSTSNYLRRTFSCQEPDSSLYISYSIAYCGNKTAVTKICNLPGIIGVNTNNRDICIGGAATVRQMNLNTIPLNDNIFISNVLNETGCNHGQWLIYNDTVQISSQVNGNFNITIKQTVGSNRYSVIYDIGISCIEPTPSFNPTNNPITSSSNTPTTISPTTALPTSSSVNNLTQSPSENPTTTLPTTSIPTAATPATASPTTSEDPTTSSPTSNPTTASPTNNPTVSPTNNNPTTYAPTTNSPITSVPTNNSLTTALPTTNVPTTSSPTVSGPTTMKPTTAIPTADVSDSTTANPTTTTYNPTTALPTSNKPTTYNPSTNPITSSASTQLPTSFVSFNSTTASPITSNPITLYPTTTNPTTLNPTTSNPTISVPTSITSTTKEPTGSTTGPTSDPSLSAVTQRPTVTRDNDIIFYDHSPVNGTIISNSYDRFVVMIEFAIRSQFNFDTDCVDCFEWFINGIKVNDIDDITVYNLQIDIDNIQYEGYDVFESYLIINSIINNDDNQYCLDNTTNHQINTHILQPGNNYNIQLKINYHHIDDNYYDESQIINVITNKPPWNGQCEIQNIDNLQLLEPFNLKCSNWKSSYNTDITYNALLINDVLMSNEFKSNAENIFGIVPTGTFQINVLIKDAFQSITCYPINAYFPIVDEITVNDSNFNVNDLFGSINNITNNNNNITAEIVSIALNSVINSINIDRSTSSNLIEGLINNTLRSSNLLDSNIPLTADAISSQLSSVLSLTSNPQFINDAVMDVFIDQYVAMIFNVFDRYINQNSFRRRRRRRRLQQQQHDENANPNTNTNALPRMVSQTQHLLLNLEVVIADNMNSNFSNRTVSDTNDISDVLIENSLYASNVAVVDAFPGESYKYILFDNHTNTSKSIIATKFENTNKTQLQCGLDDSDNIIIPMNFSNSNLAEFSCSFSKIELNNFISSNNTYTSVSDIIAINLYSDYNEDNNEPIKHEANQCEPYLISVTIKNETMLRHLQEKLNDINSNIEFDENLVFPGCNFWDNSNDGDWNKEGCFVSNVSIETKSVICGCVHLSTFQVSADDFIPKANVMGIWRFQQLTIGNILKHPTVTITLSVLFVLILSVCFCSWNENENRSILAYEDIIFEKTRNEKLRLTEVGKQIDYISRYLPNQQYMGLGIKAISKGKEAKKSLCLLQTGLYATEMRNAHTLLSVFQKTEGTNYSSKQRLGCFYIYLVTVTVGSAMVYGVDQTNLFGDISASFLISLFGSIPAMITKNLFVKSKPRIIPTTFNIDTKKEKKDDNEIISKKTKIKMKQKRNLDILHEHQNEELEMDKIIIVDEVRRTFFHSMYPLHHNCKKVSWILIICWTIIVNIMAIQYGLQFDLTYDQETNIENKCWENHLKLFIERSSSILKFNELNDNLKESNDYSDNYGGHIQTESLRWLLTCIQSFIMSIFIWQPITIYIMIWIKIWLFSWNLGFDTGIKNILYLIKKCCCMSSANIMKLKEEQEVNESHEQQTNNKQWITIYQDRPLDLIGYFANDRLFAKTENPNDINIYSDDIDTLNTSNRDTAGEHSNIGVELVTLHITHDGNNNDKDAENKDDDTDDYKGWDEIAGNIVEDMTSSKNEIDEQKDNKYIKRTSTAQLIEHELAQIILEETIGIEVDSDDND